jgi:hypothetical protein
LRCWQPRRPAAGLKRRIFSAARGEPSSSWFLGWLVPVTACALFTFLVFKADNNLSVGVKPVIGAVLSDQNYAAFASNGSQNEQNHLSGVTFDWTNGSVSTSSITFTPSVK